MNDLDLTPCQAAELEEYQDFAIDEEDLLAIFEQAALDAEEKE